MKWLSRETIETVKSELPTIALMALVAAVIWLALENRDLSRKLNATQEERIKDQKIITSYGITLVQLYKEFNAIQDKQILEQYGLKNRTNSNNADSAAFTPIPTGVQ